MSTIPVYLYLFILFWETLVSKLESWRLEFGLKFEKKKYVLTLSSEVATLLSKIISKRA